MIFIDWVCAVGLIPFFLIALAMQDVGQIAGYLLSFACILRIYGLMEEVLQLLLFCGSIHQVINYCCNIFR